MGMRQRRAARDAGAWLAAGACWAALLSAPAGSEQQRTAVATPGRQQTFKAAVQHFTDGSAAPRPEGAAEFREALALALEFSSAFELIDPKSFPETDRAGSRGSRSRLACADWTAIGADAYLEGEIRGDSSRYSAGVRVWDTRRCERLLRKSYRQGVKRDPSILAKRIADDVVAAFTGVRGVASTELVFVSDRSGSKEIYLMDADGGRQRAVTANRAINGFPGWSPDGDSIVFTSYRSRNQPALFLMTRGRGKPERLLAGLDPQLSAYRGVFDPAGKRLAVVMSDGGPSEIYTARPDARKLRRITRNGSIDISPTWSPNGEQIAFVSDRSGAPQIYVMDADGGNPRRLTHSGSYNTAPAWSPDGSWIAYETNVGGQFDIWLIDPQGEVNVPLVTHPRSDESPTWAPDSRKLGFSSSRGGKADIYVVDVGVGKARRLTEGAGDNTSPAWGPFPP